MNLIIFYNDSFCSCIFKHLIVVKIVWYRPIMLSYRLVFLYFTVRTCFKLEFKMWFSYLWNYQWSYVLDLLYRFNYLYLISFMAVFSLYSIKIIHLCTSFYTLLHFIICFTFKLKLVISYVPYTNQHKTIIFIIFSASVSVVLYATNICLHGSFFFWHS